MANMRKYGRRSQRDGWGTMLSSMNRHAVKYGEIGRARRRARRNLKKKQKGGFFL